MYEITEIQDVSKVRCKRLVAHVRINTSDKSVIKTVIAEATQNIKNKHSANVVWLYIHKDSKMLCRTLWVDKELKDIPLPKPLEYNDWQDDIGIVWL